MVGNEIESALGVMSAQSIMDGVRDPKIKAAASVQYGFRTGLR
jgi:hypothetical protein